MKIITLWPWTTADETKTQQPTNKKASGEENRTERRNECEGAVGAGSCLRVREGGSWPARRIVNNRLVIAAMVHSSMAAIRQ